MAVEAGQEAYPNLIAKYLLDGWCMLNESCATHLTPLLRSREGRELCVACEAMRAQEGGGGGGGGGVPPAPKLFLPERRARGSEAEAGNSGNGGKPKAQAAQAHQPRAAPADGLWEVLVQGPDLRFSCTRLSSRDARDKRRLRLLAETLAVKVRLGAAVGVDAGLLREATAEICGKLGHCW